MPRNRCLNELKVVLSTLTVMTIVRRTNKESSSAAHRDTISIRIGIVINTQYIEYYSGWRKDLVMGGMPQGSDARGDERAKIFWRQA